MYLGSKKADRFKFVFRKCAGVLKSLLECTFYIKVVK